MYFGIKPYTLLSKVRTGIHFRIDSEDADSEREKELVYIAYDTRKYINNLEACMSESGVVDIEQMLLERVSSQVPIGDEIGGEIEVNAKCFILPSRNNPEKRASKIITGFLKPYLKPD